MLKPILWGRRKTDFNAICSPGNRVELVATGFEFTEGPIWFEEDQSLLFSDIPASRILKLNRNGHVEVFRHPSANSNGLTRDRKGRLVACEHSTRRVTRTEPGGEITVLADRYRGKRLNSPNDVVIRSDGGIYFTDPPYGVGKGQRELAFQGVYHLPSDGSGPVLVAEDFEMPNGLAFSPDEEKLYIDDSVRRHIRVFDVESDGGLSNGRIFQSMNSRKRGLPDGMKVDRLGNLYCAGAGGIWVFDPRGRHLGIIEVPEIPTNCAWGDNDRRSLFITAGGSVYRVRLSNSGCGLWEENVPVISPAKEFRGISPVPVEDRV